FRLMQWLLLTSLCCPALTPAANITVKTSDQSSAMIANAVVYVVPVNAKSTNPLPANAVIDQIKKEFVPLVSVVQVGAAVMFPNKDNIRHHVYSFSPTKVFQLKLYSGVPAQPVIFDKPGLVVMGCNIHDGMVAYLLVVDTPWFAKTDAEGKARLENLPAGAYELHAWSHRLPDPNVDVTRRIDVTADAEFSVSLNLKPQ
ncbi:MAG TPA: methylamine utilization protein, partial [Burkholderiales bacterium]|nr:methylamine utilization protein [Burkholderiales bacterium]